MQATGSDIDIWQNFIVDFQGSESAIGQDYGGMYNFDIPKWYPCCRLCILPSQLWIENESVFPQQVLAILWGLLYSLSNVSTINSQTISNCGMMRHKGEYDNSRLRRRGWRNFADSEGMICALQNTWPSDTWWCLFFDRSSPSRTRHLQQPYPWQSNSDTEQGWKGTVMNQHRNLPYNQRTKPYATYSLFKKLLSRDTIKLRRESIR